MLNHIILGTDKVLGLDDEKTEIVLDTLSVKSARQILIALEDGQATVSELADRTDLTEQNISYHLKKLIEADLVTIDGKEGTGRDAATVYAPAKSLAVSTNTAPKRDHLRIGTLSLLAGLFVLIACLHSLTDLSIAVSMLIESSIAVLISAL